MGTSYLYMYINFDKKTTEYECRMLLLDAKIIAVIVYSVFECIYENIYTSRYK